MEELPDYKQIKGQLDRSYVLKFVVGRPKYNIKDVIKNAGDPKFEPLYNQLLEIRKLLMLKRLQTHSDVIYDVNLNVRNRNAELTKPLIRLFRNSPRALSELLPVLSQLLKEKNEAKGSSFESKLFEAIKNLVIEKKGQLQRGAYILSHEDLCNECRKVMDGREIANKPQSFYTVDFGAISHKRITETYRSKFKAKASQTGGGNNKRCLIFSAEVLDRIGLYYDNPENIEILCDDVRESNYDCSINTTMRNDDSKNNGITDITDFNDKQAIFEDIPQTSKSPEKQSVTDLRNMTDRVDVETPDRLGAAGTSSKNIKNNSNNTDVISNSYNNGSNNLATSIPHCSANTPSLSSGCVISVIPLPNSKVISLDNSLDGLPTLSCLFCSTYKTKIRFDMDLHLYEKHKQKLVYDLPISHKKASIDDRLEYALQLIEQGKIILPNDPNDDR